MLKFRWLLYDFIGLAGAAYGSYTLYFLLAEPPHSVVRHIRLGRVSWTVLMVGFGLIVNYLWELYEPSVLGESRRFVFSRLLYAACTLAMVVVLVNYALFFPGIGRTIMGLSVLGALAWGFCWRSVRAVYFLHQDPEGVIIVGEGEFVKELCLAVRNSNHHPYAVSKIVSASPPGEPFECIPIVKAADVERAIVEKKVKHVLLIPNEKRAPETLDRLVDCLRVGVRYEDAYSFYERLTGRIPVQHIDKSWLLSQVQSLGTPAFAKMKRVMDFAFALFGLIVALPIGLVIALLIKLDSSGPIFYYQRRVGFNGKIFELIKFRTMVQNAEKDGPLWTLANDGRVTATGRGLRRFRLDEMPQLWNIIEGHMSFVGPRPERPEFVEMFRRQIPLYECRHLVRPGLTGWAQVRYRYGAGVEDACRKLEYDMYYIKNQGLLTDLLILGRTISVVLGRMGSR